MTMRLIFVLMLISSGVRADWVNFPAAQAGNHGTTWDDIKTNWFQLIFAIRERGVVAGYPSYTNFGVVSGWSVPFGTSNSTGGYIAKGFADESCNWALTRIEDHYGRAQYANVYGAKLADQGGGTYSLQGINGGGYINHSGYACTNWLDAWHLTPVSGGTVYTSGYTSVYEIYTNVTSTNYAAITYTDAQGHPHTVRPEVTQSDVAFIDNSIMTLIPMFVLTNAMVDGKFDDWFTRTNALPMCTASNLFRTNNIGFVDTNGVTYFTRYPKQTNYWLLAEAAYTGKWITTHSEPMAMYYFTNTPPVARYITATNVTAGTFALSGMVIRTDGIVSNGEESIMISSTNATALAKVWVEIDTIKNTGGGHTGDTLTIGYNKPTVIYGDSPFEMYASDLDERQKVLSLLTMTARQPGWPTDGANTNGSRVGYTEFPTSWEAAMGDAEISPLQVPFNTYNINSAGAFTIGIVFSDESFTNPVEYLAEIVALTNDVKLSPTLAGASNFTAMAYIYNAMSTNVVPVYPYTTNPYVFSLGYDVIATGQTTFAFDAQGDSASYKTNYSQWVDSYQLHIGETQKVWFGKLDPNYSPVWCDKPVILPNWQTTVKGYTLKSPIVFYDWTKGTKPLVYK